MNKPHQLITGLLLLLASALAQAEMLVQVHGYLGSAASWETSGVNAALSANGWQRAGVVVAGAYGPQIIANPAVSAANKIYSVQLPSLAPMMFQADLLQSMLHQLALQHPDEPMVLIAHSAGGVVARIALVRGGAPNAKALITIATPHLGTARAIQALDATDTPFPFCLVEDFFSGGQYSLVRNSRGVLLDLVPAQQGSLLHWLNVQAHPTISYHSIVRTGPVGLGDELVPLFSQDMNNAPALKGLSTLTQVASDHRLNPQDGVVLAKLLKQM